jgi:hypothetical protein
MIDLGSHQHDLGPRQRSSERDYSDAHAQGHPSDLLYLFILVTCITYAADVNKIQVVP